MKTLRQFMPCSLGNTVLILLLVVSSVAMASDSTAPGGVDTSSLGAWGVGGGCFLLARQLLGIIDRQTTLLEEWWVQIKAGKVSFPIVEVSIEHKGTMKHSGQVDIDPAKKP